MNSFVMCKKFHCPKAINCFRLRASPNDEQNFDEFPGICNQEDNYKLFMKIRDEDIVVELELKENKEKTEDEAEIPKNESPNNGVSNP